MAASIVKTVKRYGNSGGIYVPRSWIGGKVRIELVEEPSNPLKDLIKLPLEHVVSIIIYGSHVRKEHEEGSDIDVLVVVDDDAKINVPHEFKAKNYDLQIKTESEFRRGIVNDPLFYKTLKDEGMAIINHKFLDELKREKPKKDAIKTRLELAESSLNIVKELFRFEGDNRNLVYPLMLRTKEIILIEFFLSGKKYSLKALEKELADYGITKKEFVILMDIYRASRNGKIMPKHKISDDAIKNLISMLEKKIKHVREKTY